MQWSEVLEQEFTASILRELYNQWLSGENPNFNPRAYLEERQADLEEGSRVLQEMEEEGLISIFNFYNVSITTRGVFETQKRGLVDDEAIDKARRAQTELLLSLDLHRDPVRVPEEMWNHADLLDDLGYIKKEMVPPHATLTSKGRQEVRRVKRVRARLHRFGEFQSLPPQTRGREFQKLVHEILEEEGWNPENTRSIGEEVDIVFERGGRYYLAEVKWMTDPVQAEDIRNFEGKLSDRIAGTVGCVISMSGFSTGAIDIATRILSRNKVILLFGRTSIQDWVSGRVLFQNLLESKLDVAIKKRALAAD